MSLVLDFPETDCGIARVKFEVERIDQAAPEVSGRQGGVQLGWPLWSARYELDRMDSRSGDQWRAFLDRLRGRQRLFLGGDVARPFPRNYPGGFSGGFNGSASGWAQSIDANLEANLGLSGLPAGLAMQQGDFIGFKWNASGVPAGQERRRAMVRLTQAAVANGSGVLNAKVEPPIDTRVVPAGAIAHLDRPECLLRLVPKDSKIGATGSGGSVGGGSIVAIQELRP